VNKVIASATSKVKKRASTYVGDMKDGKRDGFGTFKCHDGRSYEGQWKGGLRCGMGKMTMRSGNYFGVWKNDKQNGIGELSCLSGMIIKGYWTDGVLTGIGKIEFNYRFKIDDKFGDWTCMFLGKKASGVTRYAEFFSPEIKKRRVVLKFDKETHTCVMEYPGNVEKSKKIWMKIWLNGRVYVGEMKDGKRHGDGTYFWRDGRKFVGTWKNDKRSKGVLFIPDWRVYGSKPNKSMVYGRMNSPLFYREIYDCEWENDKPNGEGNYKGFDGPDYEGSWKDGRPHGIGVQTWVNNKQFTGEFRNGLRKGVGIMVFPDGAEYAGEFYDDDQKGLCLYRTDGKMVLGTWENGRLVSQETWSAGKDYDYRLRNSIRVLDLDEGSYVGEVKHDNEPDGLGIMIFPDGAKYIGHFKNFEFSGQGTFFLVGGGTYNGGWLHSDKHGEGVYTDFEGHAVVQVWDQGILQKKFTSVPDGTG